MLRLRLFLAAIVVAIGLGACATTATDTFNDKAAIAMRSVTAARQTSTVLLQAHKITPAEHLATEKRLDAVVEGIANARAQYFANPPAAEAKLAAEKAAAEQIDAKLKGK